MLFVISLAALLFTTSAVSQTCGPTARCASGCCSKWGWCGFGPEHCGSGNCVGDCDRKSTCNFPAWGPNWSQWALHEKCPQDQCCSKHGYCGTSEEYCGPRTLTRTTTKPFATAPTSTFTRTTSAIPTVYPTFPAPSCRKGNGFERVIGYYEGWATGRPCNKFTPEQIPVGVYTHIYFAFATIDPVTFEVQPGSPGDVDLYKRFSRLKRRDRDLKVYISIGGWTFNDPEQPTRHVFSDLAASKTKQDAFFKSLKSFMSKHDFDGVDIDWEYPVQSERSGRKEDYENFPILLARLKDYLEKHADSDGLTIAIPAPSSSLQHYNLKAMEKSVDWFNVMSYDIHGTWDSGMYPHTNLTEIKEFLEPIYKQRIDPSQIALGLGFFGHSFTVKSTTCVEPGCPFVSGGKPGPCTESKDTLAISEIDDIIKQNNIKPKLYRDAAIKVASWGDQWVGYDDVETLKLKVDFAERSCLGGLMVWAVSIDTPEGKYSKALGRFAGRI